MANALIISKQTGGYFSFNLSIDGVPQDEVRSIQNDLLTVGNTLHFKTSNGANIIKQQNIVPAELTIIASGTFTFATVTQVWDKLIEVGFFDWLGTGGGAGVDRFDDLLDTFQYFGKDGYVCVVNESQQKLEAVPFYNYRRFTQLEDAPSYLVPNKMVVVNPTGTALILKDQPVAPDTYLNSVGYFDYNDSVTHTTPLTFVANTPKKLTNDILGANTNTSQNPYGVSYVWNSTTNQFDFSQLSIGDTLDIRIQVRVTTTTANQKFRISAKLGIGSVAQFENTILSSQVKTAGAEEISFVAPFYIGSSYIKDFPAELYLTSDNGGTIVIDGWYVRILRKNINIITVETTVTDATTLAKGIVRLGGDLAGTADNPTVPALATKIGSSRLINTTAPLSGGGDLSADRTLSIAQSNTSTDGYLSGGDWTTFNNKQVAISFTTTGSSGASTFVANALNIPNYTLAGLGGQPLNSNLTSVSSLSYVSPAFVKMTGANTFALDTTIYANDSNVLHKTTNESFTEIKSSTNTGTSQINGLVLTNNGTTLNSQVIRVNNNGSGLGMLTDNQSTGYGIYANNGNSGYGIYSYNYAGGKGIYSYSQTNGIGLVLDCSNVATGNLFEGKNNGTTTSLLTKLGDFTATSFVKSGGLSTEYLKADGTVSTLTNPITGTGTINYLPRFTSASALGNSLVYDNGTNILVNTTTDDGLNKFQVNGSISVKDFSLLSGGVRNGMLINPSVTVIGDSIKFAYGINMPITLTNTGAGGTNLECLTGLNLTAISINTNTTARIQNIGINTTATRNSASDVSTVTANTLVGVVGTSSHTNVLPTTIVTGTATGGSFVISNASGTMTDAYGVKSNLFSSPFIASLASTITNYYAFNSSGTIGASSGNSGLVSNYYAFYATPLTVNATGTVTNRWGAYIADSSMINYFAGNVLIGTTTNNGDKLQVSGGNISVNSQQNIIYSSSNNDAALFQRSGSFGSVIRIGRVGVSTLASIDYPASGELGLSTNGAERINISSAGVVKVSNLTGTGSRTVVADASGNLSASTTSNPNYKVYTALLTQSGTSAPTVTVLENTVGSIVWTRNSAGVYTGTLTGAFTVSKTFITSGLGNAGMLNKFRAIRLNASDLTLTTLDSANASSDTILNDSILEIRVYL